MWKKRKLDPFPIPYTKVNSKRVTELKVNKKTTQVLKENMGDSLYNCVVQNSSAYPHVGTKHGFLASVQFLIVFINLNLKTDNSGIGKLFCTPGTTWLCEFTFQLQIL